MQKTNHSSTIKSPMIQRAKLHVNGFAALFAELEQKIILGSLSKSALLNDGRCIAKISLY